MCREPAHFLCAHDRVQPPLILVYQYPFLPATTFTYSPPYAKNGLAKVSIEMQLIYYASSTQTTEALHIDYL